MNSLTTFYDLLSTKDIYKYELKKFVNFLNAGNHGFNLESLQAYKEYLIKRSYKARTVNKYILVAKNAFRAILDMNKGNISHDSKDKIDKAIKSIKRIKEPDNSCNKILSESEIKTFLEKCDNKEIALMFKFMYKTGVRVSEMLNIKHSDLKYIGKKIYEIRILGKGSRERSVYCEQSFIKILKDFFKSSTFLFQSKRRKRSRSYVSMFIKRYCKRFIDRHNISAHILRHTFCAHSLENGYNLEQVRIMAGHSDIKTTAKFYSHVVVKPEQFINAVHLTT